MSSNADITTTQSLVQGCVMDTALSFFEEDPMCHHHTVLTSLPHIQSDDCNILPVRAACIGSAITVNWLDNTSAI